MRAQQEAGRKTELIAARPHKRPDANLKRPTWFGRFNANPNEVRIPRFPLLASKIIVPAHTDHIFWLAENMRQADVDEVAAEGGRGPYAALRDSLNASAAAWTGLVNDEPVCVFGVSPTDILGGTGSPWLLGTDKVERYAVTFLRLNKKYVAKMLELFPHLVNYVDVRNETSIRWLRWLGFKLDSAPVPYGMFGMPFFRFEMKRR